VEAEGEGARDGVVPFFDFYKMEVVFDFLKMKRSR
jgi:hypothetical protein